MKNRTLTNGRHAKPGEAFTIGKPASLREDAAQEHEACNAEAAITLLARGYAAELAARVKAGHLPYSLEHYLERVGDAVAEQCKALGIPDHAGR